MELEKISFYEILSLFDQKCWDVGIISAEQLHECSNRPIKSKAHPRGSDFANFIHYNGLTNTIILIKDGHTWDYTHYDEAEKILSRSRFKNWFSVYTNYKEAALLAGLGVRAKNSLIYNYKFGFDCHIFAIGFQNEIIDLPKNRRVNNKMWKRCNGCDDCRKACPAGAIHNEKEPYWINSSACDDFIGLSDHPKIPSIKKFWHKNVYPEIPEHIVKNIKKFNDIYNVLGTDTLEFNKNGFSFDGQVVRKNGEIVNISFCRECTSQPRCSKWNGNFPYDKVEKNETIFPIKFKRGWKKN